jgi:hypothetical protein
MMTRTPAFWLCASTLTLLLLATSCTGAKLSCRQQIYPIYQEPLDLGTAAEFSVLAYATVVNTGATSIDGLMGVFPGTAIVGAVSIIHTAVNPADPPHLTYGAGFSVPAASAVCMVDVTNAYSEAMARFTNYESTDIDVVDISNKEFGPGLYKTPAGLSVNGYGTVTLRGRGVYIFQTATTLTMSVGTKMILADGARASDIYWIVGSSATFMENCEVKGTVMAYASVTIFGLTHVEGRVFALHASVNLANDIITHPY